jgi:NADH-quinone oxidoreductase subunit K
MVPVTAYLILAAVLFAVGALGVLISRNLIILFMSVELMLNAANLALIAFSKAVNVVDGQVVVFLVLTVAAAEAAVGLAMIITIFRNRETINVDRLNLLKW